MLQQTILTVSFCKRTLLFYLGHIYTYEIGTSKGMLAHFILGIQNFFSPERSYKFWLPQQYIGEVEMIS